MKKDGVLHSELALVPTASLPCPRSLAVRAQGCFYYTQCQLQLSTRSIGICQSRTSNCISGLYGEGLTQASFRSDLIALVY